MINGVTQPFLARLETNGSVDKTFASTAQPNAAVAVIAIQADDKIVMVGISPVLALPRGIESRG